jgi:hypothetical protein
MYANEYFVRDIYKQMSKVNKLKGTVPPEPPFYYCGKQNINFHCIYVQKSEVEIGARC